MDGKVEQASVRFDYYEHRTFYNTVPLVHLDNFGGRPKPQTFQVVKPRRLESLSSFK